MTPVKANLLDALLLLCLLIALVAGVDVRIIVAIYLALDVLSHLGRAATAFLDPIVKSLQSVAGKRTT